MYNEALNCESVVENLPSGNCFFFLSILLHKVILFFILELKSCKSKLRSSNSMHISDDDCSVLNKTN